MIVPVLAVLLALPVSARDWSKTKIEARRMGPGVYMLIGEGGNIGVSAGEDGVFLIDDQVAPLTEKILAAVGRISKKPVRFVLNTHWHGDHTGGNEKLGRTGAVIVAHDNVRARLSADQLGRVFGGDVKASPKGALPVVTFSERVSFHLNGDEIEVSHAASAHTDGDAFVRFKKANVIHTGDIFFNGFYPFIDVSAGGTLSGLIAAVEDVLETADAKTRIIPGHGPPAGVGELRVYLEMLKGVRSALIPLAESGLTLEEVLARRPLKRFDAEWGDGWLKPEQFLRIVFLAVKSEGAGR
ncbi:MAG: MBL fold metallo-hydrolase [Elusimicrobiota bacterium]